jgi:adenylylsulfate kinase
VSGGAVVWITGLPSSGKSSFARGAKELLDEAGLRSCTLDGDVVRDLLVPKPGYADADRDAFYATLGGLAALLAEQGLIVLVPATAHRRAYRERARIRAPRYVEVWLDVPVAECRRRDSKGLFAGFAAGRVSAVPGEDVAYEPPLAPEVVALGGEDFQALRQLVSLLGAGTASGKGG